MWHWGKVLSGQKQMRKYGGGKVGGEMVASEGQLNVKAIFSTTLLLSCFCIRKQTWQQKGFLYYGQAAHQMRADFISVAHTPTSFPHSHCHLQFPSIIHQYTSHPLPSLWLAPDPKCLSILWLDSPNRNVPKSNVFVKIPRNFTTNLLEFLLSFLFPFLAHYLEYVANNTHAQTSIPPPAVMSTFWQTTKSVS